MATSRRFASILLLSILVFGTAGFDSRASAVSLQHNVADAYGLSSFDQVEQIRYTFNVQIGEKNIARSWLWAPHLQRVTFLDGGKPFTYHRGQLNQNPSEKLRKIDARFINDQYWLLFPLHLVWDDKAKIENTGLHPLPMGQGTGARLVVAYPPTGGYTPGDVYELFIDNQNRISHWIYHKGGSPEPTRIASWEDYRQAGPLTLSTNHRGSDGKFRLWFTGVAVKLKGSNRWIEAR